MVMHLKKKPIEVEAVHFNGKNHDEVMDFCGEKCDFDENYYPVIVTEEGDMTASPGDIIVKGVKGEFYPVKPDIMTDTYEPVDVGSDVASMEKHWNKEERDNASSADWALPAKKKLRIDDERHTKLAWDMVERVKGLSDEEKAKARRRILAKAHMLGIDTSGWNNRASISKEGFADELGELEMELVPDFTKPTYFTKDEVRAIAAGVTELPDGSGAFVAMVETPSETEVVPGPVNVISYLFTHLSEECSEVIWGACKIQRYGLDVMCPEKNMTGRQMLVKEIAEAHAVFTLINEELTAQGIPVIVMTDDDYQQAFQARVETLQREYDLGRYTVASASDE